MTSKDASSTTQRERTGARATCPSARRGSSRGPVCGILKPRSESILAYDPPLSDDEEPIVLSVHTGLFRLRRESQAIIAENPTDTPIPFVALAARRPYVQLLQVPWDKALAAVRQAASSPEALARAAHAFGTKLLESVLGHVNEKGKS